MPAVRSGPVKGVLRPHVTLELATVLIGDPKNWREHRPWITVSAAIALLLGAWFLAVRLGSGEWPGGSSAVGFTCGGLGGLLIAFEFLLWPRKRLTRAWKLGRAVTWMRAHIWLGLLTVPLILYHSGLRFGGVLTLTLVSLFSVVILSGIVGLILQQYLPRLMWENVPAETICSEIDLVGKQLQQDAERLVLAACGTTPEEAAAWLDVEPAGASPSPPVTSSTARPVGKLMAIRVPRAPIPNTEPLRVFFEEELGPFLEGEAAAESRLRVAGRAAEVFENLRTKLSPAAHAVVEDLEGLCAQRRELELQRRMHFWLHSWLCVHVPLSAALLVLMVSHIVMALRYW